MGSVADPGCLSRILIFTHPGSRISDPGSRIQNSYKREGWKKNVVKHFFVATNFTKCKTILLLDCSRKKFRPNFKELWNFLLKKLSLSSQKYEFGIQGSKRHRIPDLDPQHYLWRKRATYVRERRPTNCATKIIFNYFLLSLFSVSVFWPEHCNGWCAGPSGCACHRSAYPAPSFTHLVPSPLTGQ